MSVSPVIYREQGYAFYFVLADLSEPPHVHVGEGKSRRSDDAKIWLSPVSVARRGRFSAHEIGRILDIVKAHQAEFLGNGTTMISEPKSYSVVFPKSAYTIPTDARADRLTFDDTYMHIHLADGRIVSVPLAWVPTLQHASRVDLEKYRIGWDGQLLYWDPEDGPINEDLTIATYLKGSDEA
jgi:hypothetical protein